MLIVQIDMEEGKGFDFEVVQDGIGGKEVCWLEELVRNMTLAVE